MNGLSLAQSSEKSDSDRIFKLNKPIWKECIFAIKESIKYETFADFRKHMEETLPQNSQYVRKRYMRSVIKRFFPEKSLTPLHTLVWKNYKDDEVLQDIMRYQFLVSEPVITEFVISNLLPLMPGTPLQKDAIRNYTIKKYGSYDTNSANCIGLAIRDMGFVFRNKGNTIIREIPVPKVALLILTHYLFAQTPKTITLKEMLNNPFWKYLGIRDQDSVRRVFREANGVGIIAKYITADELEQITTKYTIREFIENKKRL